MGELGLQVLPIITNKKPLRDISQRQRPKGLGIISVRGVDSGVVFTNWNQAKLQKLSISHSS